ncbi:MAG: hypothetical protein CMH30_01190 [Micavibrio sp.]|nr:hypothetical protein [Micavibrio sp.]
MTRFDLSPFYRSTIGYDHLASLLDNIDRAASNSGTYPPYNIEKLDEHAYRISMAVAGFTDDEIDITAQENTLIVTGQKAESESESGNGFLHRGIATRNFEQRFKLADYVEVKGATLTNGMLHIELLREIPEKMKPRKVKIEQGSVFQKVKKLTQSNNKAA